MPAKPSRNLHQRLHAAMEVVKYIQKDASIKLKTGGRFKVITHDAVTKKVRPALLKQGVIYYPIEIIRTQVGNRTDVDLKVRFVNIDNPEDFIDVPGIASAITNEDKGPGMAVSYAVKYCLLKALGLETGEDADLASGEGKVAKVDPRDGAGVPAPEEISLDLISPIGEVEETFSDAGKYMTELANRVKDDGRYWETNGYNVDWIKENLPQYKKWVHKLCKLGDAAWKNYLAAQEEAKAGPKTMVRPPSDDPLDDPPIEAQSAEEDTDLTDIPPGMDRRAKFQLLSPKGKTETFTDAKKFLGALEKEMLADPVTWWALNGKLAQEIAENGDAATKGWVGGLLDMAVESGKDNPLGSG
ncbi:hypothetical protein LCGC14_1818160 [marine sediment metagenome]|uniref:Uncharacterized protein n=1 Tax=marine sediment metagenome TaxID=412755 RepID=A0A0F9GJT1_9ZZZZ